MSSVDVFVPCYNYGRFLRDCVESILTQESVHVRVLILDDCSSDNSEDVGRQLAAEDTRVEYRRHAVNKGNIATFNEGIDWVAGDYCMLLSADDLLVPGAFKRADAVFSANADVGLTHGRAIRTGNPKTVTSPFFDSAQVRIQSGYDFILSRCQMGQNGVETPTALCRTSIQRAIGYYRRDLPHTGDMEMWLRFAASGKVAYIHSDQAFYRTHGQNMSIGYQGVAELRQVKSAFDVLFAASGNRLPDLDGLRRTAYRRIGENAFGGAYHASATGDHQLAAEFTRFAQEVDPGLRFRPKWIGLRLKKLMGRKLWSVLRQCRRLMRLQRTDPAADSTA